MGVAVRACVRGCLAAMAAAGAMIGAVPADAAVHTTFYDQLPAVASGGGETVVAWTQNGVVQTASREADGSFTPGSAVGRSVGNFSPVLTITATGEQLLVWESGRQIRAAVRPAGRGPWTLQEIAGGVPRFVGLHLLVDRGGRAILTWQAGAGEVYGTRLWMSTRLPGGAWSPPSLPLGSIGVATAAMAIDGSGDLAIVYSRYTDTASPTSMQAVTLPAGATAWSAPSDLSGDDRFPQNGSILGGGGRTFVATWEAFNAGHELRSEPNVVFHTSRLRLPGAWEPPHALIPGLLEAAPGAFGRLTAGAVDSSGNALVILRWDNGNGGRALGALRLPAGEEAWTAPVPLGIPEGGDADGPPALMLADDGTAALAFLRIASTGALSLPFATARPSSDRWDGLGADAAAVQRCPVAFGNV
ncbi:MAG: hypothetical protein QOC86_819, partial [Gaiellales bacterium]|nr:hypothetical protein [Gaiellales bacterium]